MPKWLLVFVGVVAIGLAAVVGVGLTLPTSWRVERSVVIAAPVDAVYAEVGDLSRWQAWAPWRSELDPSLTFSLGTRTEGEGATLTWSGERSGAGTLTIVRAVPKEGVWYRLATPGQAREGEGAILLKPEGARTKVIWRDEGDLGADFAGRYLLPMLERALGTQFEQGLERLRARLEAGAEEAG